ncbi:hypothetical protein AB0876_31785 [Mycobacterium sp. NPDC049093]
MANTGRAHGVAIADTAKEWDAMSDAGEQLGFELWPREHDLPPRWDGLPVQWGEWDDTGRMFICPPPKKPSRCDKCGSTRSRLFCTGRIWTDPSTAPRAIGRARLQRGRQLVGLISAFRCPECRHDTVRDLNGQEWDLDETDYGDEGSFDISVPSGGAPQDHRTE